MKNKVQRDIFSWKEKINSKGICAPPKSIMSRFKINKLYEKVSLCVLRGSLSVEAALIMPFFLTILLTFFSFFIQYASAAELKVQAAAEARKIAVTLGSVSRDGVEEISACRTGVIEPYKIVPLLKNYRVTQTAVCRTWIGFTSLEEMETYVYMTPEGSVYHLYSDCTHLDLSIQSTSFQMIGYLKNDAGVSYRSCKVCGDEVKNLVYITSEGDCYHSDRSCSGLKRTIRRVPMKSVSSRSCCIRCKSRGE